MKRIISGVLACIMMLTMLFAIVSCGDDNSPKQSKTYINGVHLSDYKIVYADENDYNLRAAEYIRDKAKANLNVDMTIVASSEDNGVGAAILVGETSRALSAETDHAENYCEFSFAVKGNEIALEGDTFVVAAAAYYFVENYATESDMNVMIDDCLYYGTPKQEKAKNYILLIGDGMGFMQTEMFKYYDDTSEISDGEDIFYGYYLPYQGQVQTNSLSGLTDSAAAATAMAAMKRFLMRFGFLPVCMTDLTVKGMRRKVIVRSASSYRMYVDSHMLPSVRG